MGGKIAALLVVLVILAGCAEKTVSADEAMEISRETDEVKTLLEFDPDARAEVKEGEYDGEKCWEVSWYTKKSVNPDEPAVSVFVAGDGRVLDVLSLR